MLRPVLPLDHPHLRNGLLLQPHQGHHHICENKINLKSRFAKDVPHACSIGIMNNARTTFHVSVFFSTHFIFR